MSDNIVLRLNAKKKPIKVEINEMKNSKVLPRLLRKLSNLDELIRNMTSRIRIAALVMYIMCVFLRYEKDQFFIEIEEGIDVKD